MVLHFILMLPVLASFVYCSILMLRRGYTRHWLVVCLIMTCIMLLFYVHHCTYHTHTQPFPFATFIKALTILMIVPSVYAFVCHQLAIPWLNKHLMWMLIFAIPAHPYLVCLLLNPVPQYMPQPWGGNIMLFSYDGHTILSMYPTSMVVIMQTAMAAYRSFALSQMISQRHLLLTPKLRMFFAMVFLTAMVLVVCMMMPERFWASRSLVWLYTIVFSAIISTWLVMIPHISKEDTTFTDENANPVKLNATSSLTTLAAGLRFLLDNERIFTQPALKMEQVARMLGTNRTYLSRTIRREYDKTFPQLIMAYRIEEAKRMLRDDPKAKMNEVSQKCGFKNSSVFGKAFRNEVGTTPMDWRRLQGEPASSNRQAQYPMHDVTPT